MPAPIYGTPGASEAILREQADLNTDIQSMANEIGMPITINIREEPNVRRDTYGSIKAWGPAAKSFTIGAYPYNHSPTQRQLEKAGMKEHHDLVCWTSMRDWLDQGIDPNGFDMERCTVIADGVQWKLRERSHQNEFGNVEAYMVIGLEQM
jgi:hypothetical protein